MTEERGNKRWKSEEVNFLRDNIDKSPEWLAENLGRSIGSINLKSRKLSLTVTLPLIGTAKGVHIIHADENKVTIIRPSGSDIISGEDTISQNKNHNHA